MNQKIIQKAISKNIKTKAELNALKRKLAKQYRKSCPNNLTLLAAYRQLLQKKKIKKNRNLEQVLITRPVRTLSGIAALTVLTKPYKCPGRCIYCPSEPQMPKSYLRGEPAAQRAYLTNFDPALQVKTRLRSLDLTGHNTEKIELIILGGSFPSYPKKYQGNFVKKCLEALNNSQARNLKAVQKQNEKAKARCVGFSIEARPDQVNLNNLKWWRELGITRLEIGVQSVFNNILRISKRGHSINDTIKATQLLKDWGFKVVYHLMPNLPGSTPKKDLASFRLVFSDQNFQPDQIKIYPLVILKNAPLYKIWQKGKYKPYSQKILKELLVRIKKMTPYYVRIIRLIRDIPGYYIIAGNKITNLRQVLHQEGVICHCIRCREVKDAPRQKPYYYLQTYHASDGTEYYLSYENKKKTKLYAHLRLRFPSPGSYFEKAAIIREVHTYGRVASILKKTEQKIQHKGLGKKLIKKAESIARQNGYQKIIVISGIGVRAYYRKLGYRMGKYSYMVKNYL